MTNPEWFLVANAAHARLFQQEQGGRLAPVAAFEHPQSRQRSSTLGDDRAGHEASGHGYSGTAFEPHVSAQDKEQLHFAAELADYLERAALAGGYGSVTVFASTPFLGELKHALGHATQRMLAGSHDVDLTSVGLAELPGRIRHALEPS